MDFSTCIPQALWTYTIWLLSSLKELFLTHLQIISEISQVRYPVPIKVQSFRLIINSSHIPASHIGVSLSFQGFPVGNSLFWFTIYLVAISWQSLIHSRSFGCFYATSEVPRSTPIGATSKQNNHFPYCSFSFDMGRFHSAIVVAGD